MNEPKKTEPDTDSDATSPEATTEPEVAKDGEVADEALDGVAGAGIAPFG